MCCSIIKFTNAPDDFTVYGSQFTTPNSYVNAFLKGRFRLFLQGTKKLIYKTDWDYGDNGGFIILIPSYSVTPDTIFCGEYY